MSHNRQLRAFLGEVATIAEQAKTEDDLKRVFERAKQFRDTVGPIRFSTAAGWWSFGISAFLVVIAAACYFVIPELQYELGDSALFIGIGLAVFPLVSLLWIECSGESIDSTSNRIFEKDVFMDNKLVRVSLAEEDGERLYERWRKQFGEFRSRGDESRYIEDTVKGTYSGAESPLEYDCYVFHYVRVYYVPVQRTIGKTTITVLERRTETLRRYGIMAEAPEVCVRGVAVVGGGGSYEHYPSSWRTASEAFENAFSVYAKDEMTAAKFLKPAVILAFNKLKEHVSDLNVEIDERGVLNIAFSDDDVLSLDRKHSIAEPEAFEAELSEHRELAKLRRLLAFIDVLKKHNDSNFEVTPVLAARAG